MRFKIFVSIWLFILYSFSVRAFAILHRPPRPEFYKALQSKDINVLDTELYALNQGVFTEKEAYLGTLLMKKAGMVKRPKEKLALFKTGRVKLETAIQLNTENAEYRFLRLIIQEHAPAITKYKGQLAEDGDWIVDKYNKLPADLQKIIADYSKHSTILHSADFKSL